MNQTLTKSQKSTLKRKLNKAKTTTCRYLAGFWTGSIIPGITYHLAHHQAPDLFKTPWTPQAALWLAVLGGLAYSAPSVAEWFQRYVGPKKAWGFVIALETAMTISSWETALPALLTLCTINGLILADKFSKD